jgi:hypothetical protein
VTIRAGNNEQTFTLNWSGTPLPDGLFVKFTPPGQADFTTAASGYQSTVDMTVMRRKGGVETELGSTETVTWTSVTSSNSGLSTGTTGVWKRAAGALNGLTWGTAADTTSYSSGNSSWATDAIAGTAQSGSGTATHTASLTDVVGSRTITVKVSVGGETSSGDSFTFGKGPLSVFGIVGTTGIKWAEKWQNIASYPTNGFQDPTNDFPAAAAVCGGTVNNNVTVNGTYASDNAGFDIVSGDGWSSGQWVTGSSNGYARYAETSKLSNTVQLLAVAAYSSSYPYVSERKGAAWAAGWSFSSSYYVWTGEVSFSANIGFIAVVVDLDNGDTYSYYVAYDDVVAVCLP